MGVLTTLLKLLKPGENDYYNQQTEQADNWQKVDDYAVLTNTDKNGIWGGEYGGKIQDPIPKELNKRYIDNINGKAFICIKAGDSTVTSNTTEYFTVCNVVDNLGKLQNLDTFTATFKGVTINASINNKVVTVNMTGTLQPDYNSAETICTLPINMRPRVFTEIPCGNSYEYMGAFAVSSNGEVLFYYKPEVQQYYQKALRSIMTYIV